MCTDTLAAARAEGCYRHDASEGLLIHGEGGRYESVKQNDSDVSDDDKFAELYLFHADIQVTLHNSLFYFSFII